MQQKTRAREYMRRGGLLVIALLATALVWLPPSSWMSAIERLVQDEVNTWVAGAEPENRIVVVDIDEASLSSLGAWPWSRSQVATLVETLIADYNVRHIGLDIVFPAEADTNGDQRLQALAQTGLLTLAQVFDVQNNNSQLRTGVPVFMTPRDGVNIWGQDTVGSGFVANHSGLAQASCVGNIGVQPDSDGILRQVPLLISWEKQYSPLLPLAMLWCEGDALGKDIESKGAFAKEKKWNLRYKKSWEAYTVISAQDVIEQKIDLAALENRWVLVGSSAVGLNDRIATPLGKVVAGVMVHAVALGALLDWVEGKYVLLSKWIENVLTTAVILFFAYVFSIGMKKLNAWLLLPLLMIFLGAGMLLVAMLQGLGVYLQTTPMLVVILLFLLLMSLEWWWEQREQAVLLKIFSNYVSPVVLEKMIIQGIDKPLNPQYVDITVLSADMQGYTALISENSLAESARLTKYFLECLTKPLLKNGGTLDKYVGDGMLGFWGAPLMVENSQDVAIEAALQMLNNVNIWNKKRILQGIKPVRVRIGIESGMALVGDLGTSFRSNYTAVGDCINIASKLQAALKNYDHDIFIGPDAACKVKYKSLVSIGSLILPGFASEKNVFTVSEKIRSIPDGKN